MISEWWTGSPDNFVSTPGSGSLRWKKGVGKVAADIVQATEEFPDIPFSIEVKNHEDWTLIKIMNGSSEFQGWVEQCDKDSIRTNKHPMLIFTKNHNPVFVAVSATLFWSFSVHSKNLPRLNRLKLPESYLVISGLYQFLFYKKIVIMKAQDFFDENPPESILSNAKP